MTLTNDPSITVDAASKPGDVFKSCILCGHRQPTRLRVMSERSRTSKGARIGRASVGLVADLGLRAVSTEPTGGINYKPDGRLSLHSVRPRPSK